MVDNWKLGDNCEIFSQTLCAWTLAEVVGSAGNTITVRYGAPSAERSRCIDLRCEGLDTFFRAAPCDDQSQSSEGSAGDSLFEAPPSTLCGCPPKKLSIDVGCPPKKLPKSSKLRPLAPTSAERLQTERVRAEARAPTTDAMLSEATSCVHGLLVELGWGMGKLRDALDASEGEMELLVQLLRRALGEQQRREQQGDDSLQTEGATASSVGGSVKKSAAELSRREVRNLLRKAVHESKGSGNGPLVETHQRVSELERQDFTAVLGALELPAPSTWHAIEKRFASSWRYSRSALGHDTADVGPERAQEQGIRRLVTRLGWGMHELTDVLEVCADPAQLASLLRLELGRQQREAQAARLRRRQDALAAEALAERHDRLHCALQRESRARSDAEKQVQVLRRQLERWQAAAALQRFPLPAAAEPPSKGYLQGAVGATAVDEFERTLDAWLSAADVSPSRRGAAGVAAAEAESSPPFRLDEPSLLQKATKVRSSPTTVRHEPKAARRPRRRAAV
eukprot:SAG11_NODE_52_length_19809_cov_14.064231_12_plen_510_part_00